MRKQFLLSKASILKLRMAQCIKWCFLGTGKFVGSDVQTSAAAFLSQASAISPGGLLSRNFGAIQSQHWRCSLTIKVETRWRGLKPKASFPMCSFTRRHPHPQTVMASKVTPWRQAQKEETIPNKEFISPTIRSSFLSLIPPPLFYSLLKAVITMELICPPSQFQF